MEYSKFTQRDIAYNAFVMYRREVLESTKNGKFNAYFTELCSRAVMGDCVAQDCAAYFFNKGIPGFLAPNYEYYMAWQILAGANGNEFALEKLEFFLKNALDEIVFDSFLIALAMVKKNINRKNALYVISNLICEGIADELKLDPKNLIDVKNRPVPYAERINRKYIEAMEKSIPNVKKVLES